MATTFQSGLKEYTGELDKYSMFLGGLDARHDSLAQYEMFMNGFVRVFITRRCAFADLQIKEKLNKFVHILEYAFIDISGIGSQLSLTTESVKGGYTGAEFELAGIAEDDAKEITFKVYETSGRIVSEVANYIITGISDRKSGLGTYHGADLEFKQSNHTFEAIIVNTDRTGLVPEAVAMFSNMWLKSIDSSDLDYQAGSHEITRLDLKFSCVKDISPEINELGAILLKNNNILRDSLEWTSGIDRNQIEKTKTDYIAKTGQLEKTTPLTATEFDNLNNLR